MSNVHSNYLHCLFDNRFQHVITKLAGEVERLKKTTPIDAIAIRGMSGAIVGGALSLATGIPLICVRKGRSSHSYMRVEGSYIERENAHGEKAHEMNYIIVDDLVCEGTTINIIMKEVNKFVKDITKYANEGKGPKEANPVSILLYNEGCCPCFGWKKKVVPVVCFHGNNMKEDDFK
jgi:hypoxanthine phosphoribosyltransferase